MWNDERADELVEVLTVKADGQTRQLAKSDEWKRFSFGEPRLHMAIGHEGYPVQELKLFTVP